MQNNQCNEMFNLIINGGVHIVPISIAIAQIIEIIIVHWKPKSMHELKEKYTNLGYQLGSILAHVINFRANTNKLPTFGEENFQSYHDGF